MGRTFSKFTRPIKNINVENRAHKVLEKRTENPQPSPRYPSTTESLDNFAKEHPEYLSAQKEKHEDLIENMRKLQLNSVGPPPEIKSKTKALPENRDKVEDTEFGFLEPDTIPVGKTSIRLAMKFLAEHQAAPKDYTASYVAQEYKLDKAQVQQVLKYFQTFQMHLPKALLEKHPNMLESLGKLEKHQGKPLLKASPDVDGSKT